MSPMPCKKFPFRNNFFSRILIMSNIKIIFPEHPHCGSEKKGKESRKRNAVPFLISLGMKVKFMNSKDISHDIKSQIKK